MPRVSAIILLRQPLSGWVQEKVKQSIINIPPQRLQGLLKLTTSIAIFNINK